MELKGEDLSLCLNKTQSVWFKKVSISHANYFQCFTYKMEAKISWYTK